MELTAKDLERAIIYATQKHEGVVRKGDGRPYVMHPISVMQHLYRYKKSKNIYVLMIACLLHDCIEDCEDVSVEEIAQLFGYNVASLVVELTSDLAKVKKEGKKEYLLCKMIAMSSYALVIKLCDRLDNIQDMHSMNESFIKKYIVETEYILSNLVNSRKLSKTHKTIIKDISKEIKKYNNV
jgi:(p)ppGpp synthase/HD superfamily hydrolase